MINNSPYKSRHQKETKSNVISNIEIAECFDSSPSDFNLSDKIVTERNNEVLRKIDVEEFIRLLKEEIYNMKKLGFITRNNEQDLKRIINEKSGEKLI